LKKWKVTIIEHKYDEYIAHIEAETEDEARQLGIEEINLNGIPEETEFLGRDVFVEEEIENG
jgi:hypothetical protein